MAEGIHTDIAIGGQQVPGHPTNVFLPGTPQQEAFTEITQQIHTAVQKLKTAEVGKLKQFLKDKLFPELPENKRPVLPDSPEDLMKLAEQYWNHHNIGFLKSLSTHLCDRDLKRLVTEYEKALIVQLKTAHWDGEATVASPPGYKTLVVKLKGSLTPSVNEAVELKEILGKMKSLKGSMILLAGLGDECTSVVFYIPASAVVSFFHTLCNEADSKAKLHQRGVQLVFIPDQASLDVETDKAVFGSIDFIVDMQKAAKDCPEFGILVIGKTGHGKSTLVNCLLQEDIAAMGQSTETGTDAITAYKAEAAGVPVAIYDTPGLDDEQDSEGELRWRKEVLYHIKALNKGKKIHLTIFCFSLGMQTNLKAYHTKMLKDYHAAGVELTNVIIAVPFSGLLKAPMAIREMPNFDEATYFEERVTQIKEKLVAEFGITPAKADAIIVRPVTDDITEKLPNGKDWFIPLWLDILGLLPPAAYVRFLQIHHDNISFTGEKATIHLMGKDAERFNEIALNKNPDLRNAGYFAIGGTAAAVVGGVVIGITVAATAPIAVPITAAGVAGAGVLAALGGVGYNVWNYFISSEDTINE